MAAITWAPARLSVPRHRPARIRASSCGHRPRTRSLSAVAEDTDALLELKALPVDKGVPFIGNVIGYSGKDGDMRDKFAKYGHAFVMKTGPQSQVLCIDRPEDITAVLNSKAFMPAWPPSVMRMLAPERGSINNQEARPWRAALANVTSPSAVNHMLLPLFAPAFEHHLRSVISSGVPVRWVDTSRRLAFGVASRAIMGSLITEAEIDSMYDDYVVYAQGAFQTDFGLEQGLPFTAYNRGCAARQRLVDLLGPRIADAVANSDSLSRDLLIKKLMEFMSAEGLTAFGRAARIWPPPHDENERQSQLARTLIGEAVMLMFAGTDTTAYSLTAVLPLLYLHPEWLTALNEEQDRVVAQHGHNIGRKAIESSAVATAIAQETVRLKQAVKSTYRLAIQSTVVAGVQVPPGTVVQAYWQPATLSSGPGVEEFRPEHWLSDDHRHCRVNDDPNSMQFGSGTRACVGKYLAIAELVTALALIGRLVSRIEMDPEDATRVVTLVKGHPTGIPTTLHPRL
eukprot:jgi/Ulvmu1/6362/UM029_0070.1